MFPGGGPIADVHEMNQAEVERVSELESGQIILDILEMQDATTSMVEQRRVEHFPRRMVERKAQEAEVNQFDANAHRTA